MTTVCVTVSIGISMVQQTSLAECYDVNPSKNNQNQGKLHQALSSFWPCSENLIKNSSTLMFSVQCSVLVFSSLSQSLVMTGMNKYKDDGNACGIWIQSLSTRMTTVCVTVSIGISMVQQTSLAECYDVNPSKNNQNQGKLHQALSSFWPCSENLIKNSSTLIFSVQCSVLVFSSLSIRRCIEMHFVGEASSMAGKQACAQSEKTSGPALQDRQMQWLHDPNAVTCQVSHLGYLGSSLTSIVCTVLSWRRCLLHWLVFFPGVSTGFFSNVFSHSFRLLSNRCCISQPEVWWPLLQISVCICVTTIYHI